MKKKDIERCIEDGTEIVVRQSYGGYFRGSVSRSSKSWAPWRVTVTHVLSKDREEIVWRKHEGRFIDTTSVYLEGPVEEWEAQRREAIEARECEARRLEEQRAERRAATAAYKRRLNALGLDHSRCFVNWDQMHQPVTISLAVFEEMLDGLESAKDPV